MRSYGIHIAFAAWLLLAVMSGGARAQEQAPPAPQAPPQDQAASVDKPAAPDKPVVTERWNLYFQATSIGQYHGTFYSPYAGPFSLQDYPERDVSLTTTLFFGFRLEKNTQLYFDPEIAGGRGFSGVNGLANSSNGELPRVATATPKPYLARLYITHDFGFGSETEAVESDENQLAGERPMNRYTITAGRFTVTDFFDNNRYSHDPRTQFMGWAVMYNGAWDYPADVRGYTWGWVHEFHTRHWSLRYASAAMPQVANGLRFDRRLFVNRGDVFEGEYRYTARKHAGAVRAAALCEPRRRRQLRGGDSRGGAERRNAFGDRHAPQRHPEIRVRDQRRTGADQRHRRLCAPRLERRKDGKLRVHRHGPPGHRRHFDHRHALAPALRYGGDRTHRQRNFRRARALSGAWAATIF